MDINSLLSEVLSGLNGDTARYTDAASSVGKASTQMEAVSNQNIAQARADIPVAESMGQGAAAIEYQKAQQVQMLQRAAGMDPAVASNMYTEGLAELTAINVQRRKAAQEVTALASTNLLDDPIGYIFAQLSLPGAQGQLAGLDKQAELATTDVQNRLTLVAAAKNNLVADTADKARELAYQEAALKARAANSKLDAAAVGTQADVAAKMLQQADILAKITSNNAAAYKMIRDDQQFAAMMEDRQSAREQARVDKATYAKEKLTKEEQIAAGQAQLEAAYRTLGFNAVPDYETFRKMPNTPKKKAISDLMDGGNFGATLSQSLPSLIQAAPNLEGITAGGNAGFAKAIQGLYAASQSYIDLASKPDATGQKPKPMAAIQDGFDNYQREMESSAGSVKTARPITHAHWDSNLNVYRANYPIMLQSSIKELQNNVVMETARNVASTVPADSPNFRGIDEQQVILTVAQSVAANKISLDDAAKQMATFYQHSALINADFYGYTLLGMPRQERYMAKVSLPGFFGNTPVPEATSADLMNVVDAKRLLLGIIQAKAPPKDVGMFGVSNPMLQFGQ